MRPLDLAVIAAYFAAVIATGLLFAGRQRDTSDYFLGRHGLPWWAIMLSIVATETSALTVISIPGIAARGDLTFLQLAFGYLVGRIGVAALLLPGYFQGTQETAYQRLEHRFGTAARRTASGIFLVTRALADCVRIFATAIPLAIITHWSLALSILAIGIVTCVYTWIGGLRAVVWVDVIQLGVYLLGGIATLVVATGLAGGWPAFGTAWDAGKLAVLDLRPSFGTLYTFWGGIIGGALLSAASHGTDHLIVQRLLAARGLLGVGRWMTLAWAAILTAGAMAFRRQDTPVVQLALTIASLTYGGLLGTYLLGGLWPRARQRDVILAVVISVAVMAPIVLGAVIPRFPVRWLPGLAWPWYVPLGTGITVLAGMASSVVGRSSDQAVST